MESAKVKYNKRKKFGFYSAVKRCSTVLILGRIAEMIQFLSVGTNSLKGRLP